MCLMTRHSLQHPASPSLPTPNFISQSHKEEKSCKQTNSKHTFQEFSAQFDNLDGGEYRGICVCSLVDESVEIIYKCT